MRVVSSSPCFSKAASYSLQNLEMSQIPRKEEQRLFLKIIFDEQDVFIWLPTSLTKVCATKLPFLMDFKRTCNCVVTNMLWKILHCQTWWFLVNFRQGLVDTVKTRGGLVISCLVALMVDQVKNLTSSSVECTAITFSDLIRTENNLCNDSLLNCTSESLVKPRWRHSLDNPERNSLCH